MSVAEFQVSAAGRMGGGVARSMIWLWVIDRCICTSTRSSGRIQQSALAG